jgi:hypothetical protein
MDELHFHARRRAVVAEPCVFEKALLAGCAGCDRAVRHALAEREVLACASPVARTNCETLHALLRERSAFALRLPLPGERLPHAVTMQLVCGGLRGVGECMQQAPEDVHDLVATAQARYGSLLDLPWPAIVAAVASWKVRRRHDRGSVR